MPTRKNIAYSVEKLNLVLLPRTRSHLETQNHIASKAKMLPKPNKPPGKPKSSPSISGLIQCKKIMEGLTYNTLLPIVEINNGLSGRHYSFRRVHSTLDAINLFVDLVKGALVSDDCRVLLALEVNYAFKWTNWNRILGIKRIWLKFTSQGGLSCFGLSIIHGVPALHGPERTTIVS